jgi:hypothetical protein
MDSWEIWFLIVCLALFAVWLFAEIAHTMGKDRDQIDDWEDIYQWKLRRKREQDAARERWGGRSK